MCQYFSGHKFKRILVVFQNLSVTNMAWVLENNRFKPDIYKQFWRRVKPKTRGEDRKPEQFHSNRTLSLDETTSSRMAAMGCYVKLNIATPMCRTELCVVALRHRGSALV